MISKIFSTISHRHAGQPLTCLRELCLLVTESGLFMVAIYSLVETSGSVGPVNSRGKHLWGLPRYVGYPVTVGIKS